MGSGHTARARGKAAIQRSHTSGPGPVADQPSWPWVIRHALCHHVSLDPDQWFPASADAESARHEAAAAIAICHGCPARAQCLAMSLRHWDIGQDGVWGGLVSTERATLREQVPDCITRHHGAAAPDPRDRCRWAEAVRGAEEPGIAEGVDGSLGVPVTTVPGTASGRQNRYDDDIGNLPVWPARSCSFAAGEAFLARSPGW
jgi:hypothetical protein